MCSSDGDTCTNQVSVNVKNIIQWRTVVILVACSLGSQPAQNCEGSPAVVVLAYTTSHSNTWSDWQLSIIIKPRAARMLERRQHGTQTRID